MAKKTLQVYELYIDDNDLDGITAMGFVDNPAIQTDFLYFNKDKAFNNYTMASVDVEQRIVVGPAMVPHKKIIRQDMFGDLYYVKFSPETISDLAHKYLKESKIHLTTEQHVDPVNGVYMIESWVVENEQDKIYTKYGYELTKVPVGSWCLMYKIDNDDILGKIKSGEINGFSIEGNLSEKLSMNSQLDELLKRVSEYENKEEIIDLIKKAHEKA